MLGFVFFGLTGFWAYVAFVGVSVGLSYLGGRLLAPDQPEYDLDRKSAADRQWSPHTTQAEGIARPRSYGRNMHHGNIIAKWTDVVDETHEVLYLIVDHGDGPTEGIGAGTVYLNEQPSGNFGGVTIQERTGTMDQTCMTGYEQLKLEQKQNVELIYGEAPIVVTTPNDFFDDIEWTICFPSGLVHYRDDGSQASITTTVKVRIRPLGGDWTEIYNDGITRKTHDPLFFKFTVSDYFAVNKGTQYELEFSRLNDKYSDQSTQNVYLRSVREVVDVAFTYPGRALVGVKAIATPQLHGNLNVKVIREDRLVNTFNGTSWSIEYTRNRAWITWDVLTLPCIDGTIKRYDGMSPDSLDLEFFYAWAQFCDTDILDGDGGVEPRASCDIKISEPINVMDMSRKIAAAGRAHLYWDGHLLTGWIDDTVTDPSDLVTEDSIEKGSWKNDWAIKPELAGVTEVLYDDAKLGFERTSTYAPSLDPGGFRNVVSVDGVGLKTRGTAVHYSNYLTERTRLITNINRFRINREGFWYKLGQTVAVQSRGFGSHAFRVRSATADTITVNRNAETDVNIGDELWLRTYDSASGTIKVYAYEVASVVARVITATANWSYTPAKGNLVAVGPAGSVKLRRIIKKKPAIKNYFDVEVETYDTELFDADDLDPDNPDINFIWPGPADMLDGPVTRAEIYDLLKQILPPQPNIEIPWPSNLTWTGSGGDTVTWSKTNADFPITFRYRGVTYEIEPDSTTDEFVYWDPNYTTSFRHTNLMSTVLANAGWLMCRNVDGVVYPSVPIQTLHGGLVQAGTITASMIIVSGINALLLDNAPAEANADKTGSHSADVNALLTQNGPAEANADKTIDHTAANISGQGVLATLNSANLDTRVADGTTYKRMLASWQKSGDTTKIDGGKVSLNTLLAASIATYNLTAVNATMANLFVQTIHIANSATKIYVADSDATESHTANTWHTICTCAWTSLGGVVEARFQTTVSSTLEGRLQYIRVIYEDSTTLFELEVSPNNEGFISETLFHSVSSGSRDIKLQMKSDGSDEFTCAGSFLSVIEDKGK